jgi:hypothetical protein
LRIVLVNAVVPKPYVVDVPEFGAIQPATKFTPPTDSVETPETVVNVSSV